MAYTPTNWINGTTPVNATNLNKIEQGIKANSDNIDNINNLSIVELYSNSTGSNTSITLNDSIENYKYIEIFWKAQYSNKLFSRKICNNYSSTADTSLDYFESADTSTSTTGADRLQNSYYFFNDIGINQNQISLKSNHQGLLSLDGAYTETQNRFYITKVVGYEKVVSSNS